MNLVFQKCSEQILNSDIEWLRSSPTCCHVPHRLPTLDWQVALNEVQLQPLLTALRPITLRAAEFHGFLSQTCVPDLQNHA